MMRQSSVLGVDLIMLSAAVFLMIAGVLFIYSSSVAMSGESVNREYLKQIVWVAGGLALLVAFALTNYGRLAPLAPAIYLCCLALLLFTLAFGKVVNGARSWLGIGDLGINLGGGRTGLATEIDGMNVLHVTVSLHVGGFIIPRFLYNSAQRDATSKRTRGRGDTGVVASRRV